MCIKCGCGKKAGQPGYGMGPKGSKKTTKKAAKKTVRRGLFGAK